MSIFVGQSGHLPDNPTCPACGTVLDGYTPVGALVAHPKDGDLTICAYCRAPGAYQVDAAGALTVRTATPTEATMIRTRLGGGTL